MTSNTGNSGFLRLYLRAFIKPSSTFDLILNNSNTLRYGLYAFLVPVIGYTLFYIMAWQAGGEPSTFKPWLNIHAGNYFRYDIFLTLPGYYLAWTVSASTLFLLARLMRGSGSYDNVVAVTGFGIGVATWSSLLHDLIDAVLAVTGVIDMKTYERLLNEPTFWRFLLWILYTIYFLWFITLFTIGIRKAFGFSRVRSVIMALAGLAVYQVILFIFIR